MANFVIYRVEDIVAKGENAGYQIFSFSHNVLKSAIPSGSLKVGIVW